MSEKAITENTFKKGTFQLLESMEEGVLITDRKGKILDANEGFQKITGFDRKEVRGEELIDVVKTLIKVDALEQTLDLLKKEILKRSEGDGINITIESKDGEKRKISIKSFFLEGEKSKAQNFTIIRDITGIKKETEEELKEINKKIKKLHEKAMEFEKCKSEESICESVVEASEKILDHYVSSIDFVEDDRFVVKATVRGALEKGNTYPIEGIAEKTFKKKESFLIHDVDEEEDAVPRREAYRSAISVPVGDIGVFQALSEERGYFDETDLELAEILVNHAAEAIKRLRYEEELKRSKKRFETLISKAQEGIYIRDLDGKMTYVNEKFADIHGYDREEIIGKKSWDLLHPDSKKELENSYEYDKDSVELDTPEEIKIVRKDGTIRTLKNLTSVIETDEGKREVLGFVHDITERRVREEELKRKEERFRLLGRNAPAIIYLCRYEKCWPMVYINEAVEDITGYPKESFLNGEMSFYDLYHPEDREEIFPEVDKALAEDRPFRLNYRIIDADGDVRWLEEFGDAIRDEGEIEHLVGSVFDITERKEREKKIKHLNSLLRSIRNINQLITKEDDLTELMKSARDVLMQMRGYLDVSILITGDEGKEVIKKVGDMNIDDLKSKMKEMIETENMIQSREGDHTDILTPMVDKDIEGVLVVRVDKEMEGEELDLLKEVAGDLAMAKNKIESEERLKRSLREKEVLLDEIHHRVKNNLQVISSMLHLQVSKEENETTSRVLQDIQNRIRSMALTHEMLHSSEDVSRIDLARYIDELVRTIYQTYDVSFEEVKLEMDLDEIEIGIDQANPCVQVINEIICNSLQHAFPKDHEERGKLQISSSLTEDENVEIIVSDNGVGLPEGIDLEKSETFGFRLIKILVEDQLDGHVELDRERGTTFKIRFEKESETHE